jgi:hypothetical protein
MGSSRTSGTALRRKLFPVLPEYLKDCGVAGPLHGLAPFHIDTVYLEAWILDLLAHLFLDIHDHPSVRIPRFRLRCCTPDEEKLAGLLHGLYVKALVRMGWIVRDRTKIYCLNPRLAAKIDDWAK